MNASCARIDRTHIGRNALSAISPCSDPPARCTLTQPITQPRPAMARLLAIASTGRAPRRRSPHEGTAHRTACQNDVRTERPTAANGTSLCGRLAEAADAGATRTR